MKESKIQIFLTEYAPPLETVLENQQSRPDMGGFFFPQIEIAILITATR